MSENSAAESLVSISSVKLEQLGALPAGLLPPRVEVPPRHDLCGHALLVEGDEVLVVDEQVTSTGAFLPLPQACEQRLVLRREGVVRVPVALDQGVPDEELARVSGSMPP